MPYTNKVLFIYAMYGDSKTMVFFINSIYIMYRDHKFMYCKYRAFSKKLILRLILYMLYINKVLFIHIMYRDSKTIIFFKSTIYIRCIGRIILCIVSIDIQNKTVIFKFIIYMPYIDKAFLMHPLPPVVK